MIESKKRVALGSLIVASLAAASYAGFLYTTAGPINPQVPGAGVVQPSSSPGAGQFFFPTFINPAPAGGSGASGGDVIVAVHEGRDERGPFAAIEWIPSANQNPLITNALMGAPRVPTPAIAGTMGVASLFAIYRPTNDPFNPGWGTAPIVGPTPSPAAPGQIESAVSACHHFAEAVRAAIKFQNDIVSGAVTIPLAFPPLPQPPYAASIWIELDIQIGSPSLGEFYKFSIATR